MPQNFDFMQLSMRYNCPKCGADFPKNLKKQYQSDGEYEWLSVKCLECEFEWLEHVVSATYAEKVRLEQRILSKVEDTHYDNNVTYSDSQDDATHDTSSNKSYW